MSLVRASVSAQDRDSVRRASVGAGKTAVVVGGEGRMGRWFVQFLADQGYATGTLDVRASDEENAWARQALPTADLVDQRGSAGRDGGALRRVGRRIHRPASSPTSPASRRRWSASIRRLQQAGARVASMHPMFGPSVVLLRDCDVVICDTGDLHAQREVERLFSTTTARVVHLPLDEHDRQMADVLTLAHATAIAFALALPEQPTPLRSTTLGALRSLSSNVVRESPDVYFEIQARNPNSAQALTRLAAAIGRVQAAVQNDDAEAFAALMEEGQARANGRLIRTTSGVVFARKGNCSFHSQKGDSSFHFTRKRLPRSFSRCHQPHVESGRQAPPR